MNTYPILSIYNKYVSLHLWLRPKRWRFRSMGPFTEYQFTTFDENCLPIFSGYVYSSGAFHIGPILIRLGYSK